MNEKTLIVITGPTGIGKTAVAIAVAQHLGCEIINADSRQIYRGIPICTAAPTAEEQAMVKHHFVGFLNLDEYYSAAQFESDVMALLPTLWKKSDYAVLCGGSMMYVDAVCKGIDLVPDISPEVRAAAKRQWKNEGIEPLLAELKQADPDYYAIVDKKNPKRIVHAIEVCRQTGKPYSTFRTGKAKERPFRIIKIGLNMAREQLFERINARVDAMMEMGLEQEAECVRNAALQFAQHGRIQGNVCLLRWHDGLPNRPRTHQKKHASVCQKATHLVCQRPIDTVAPPGGSKSTRDENAEQKFDIKI